MAFTGSDQGNLASLGTKLYKVIGAVVLSLLAVIALPQMFENVDAKDIVVIQSMVGGELTVHTEPGLKWQGGGKVTTYPRRDKFSFVYVEGNAKAGQEKVDDAMTTRFNDGGHGKISGTINWAMPLSVEKIKILHKDFGSFQAIEASLIRPSLQKVVYNVGPTMSSTESSAERRPEIPKYIDDQLLNGPYMTKTVQKTVKDPITDQEKLANVVEIALGADGKPTRETKSQIAEYGLQLQPVAIDGIRYDDVVENQIKERQKATTQVQISIANARKAEQDAITTAEQGKADAAKAKWSQETVNAKEIAEAEKNKRVAELEAQTAAEVKRRLVLEGEGEAAKKRLIMEADGALDKKLEAYVAVNRSYADAIKSAAPGAWTPQVSMGSAGGNGGSNAAALVELMTAKAASELGLDRTVTKGAVAKK